MTNSPNSSSEHAFSQLTEEEKQKLYRLLLERDFGGFVRAAWPILEPSTPLSENWHIDLIAEYLTLVRRREIRRLIINIPPRMMKSLSCTVMFPAWVWATEPHTRFICSSYADSLSIKHSLDRRTLIGSPWYQALWGNLVKFADDQNLKSEFQNAARGVMIATSTGGSITGKGADFIIVDDPHNPLQALSDAERVTALRHFDYALSTRLDNPTRGAIVVVMQRLNEGDLTGHLIAQQGWEQLSIPAEAERDEVWKFPISKRVHVGKAGESVWPERFSQEVLEQFKVRLGSYQYAGQFQQRPSPAEGGILKRSWWKRFETAPEKFDQMIQSWDFTFKDSKGSDYVVGQVWGRVGSNKYLLDQIRGRYSFSQSLAAMRTMTIRWPQAHAKLVEDKANGPAIIDTLRNELSGIVAVSPQGSKLARAQGWTIFREYVDHETGKNDDRSEFQAMFRDASQRKFDVLLFWALDRLSREGVLETLQHLNRLTSYGVGYRSFTEQYFDSCGIFKDAVIAIIATVAKQERIRISQRVKAGLETARAKGKRLGRPCVAVDAARISRLRIQGRSVQRDR